MNGHSDNADAADQKGDKEKNKEKESEQECDDAPKTSITTTTMKKGDYEERSERTEPETQTETDDGS